MTAEEVIDQLNLAPLPGEGGYFRQTYKSDGVIPHSALPNYGGQRRYSTCIYFLMTSKSFSALHTVNSDELWHFHAGDVAQMVQIDSDGVLRDIFIGPDLKQHQLQVVIPAGVLQGARLVEGGQWALYSCTVAPGFEFEDTEVPDRSCLIQRYPQHADVITSLTHG